MRGAGLCAYHFTISESASADSVAIWRLLHVGKVDASRGSLWPKRVTELQAIMTTAENYDTSKVLRTDSKTSRVARRQQIFFLSNSETNGSTAPPTATYLQTADDTSRVIGSYVCVRKIERVCSTTGEEIRVKGGGGVVASRP